MAFYNFLLFFLLNIGCNVEDQIHSGMEFASQLEDSDEELPLGLQPSLAAVHVSLGGTDRLNFYAQRSKVWRRGFKPFEMWHWTTFLLPNSHLLHYQRRVQASVF